MSDRLQIRCASWPGSLLPAVAVVLSIALPGWAPQQNAAASVEVEAVAPGEYEVVAIVPAEGATLSLRDLDDQIAARIHVVVPQPPARSVSFVSPLANFYAGTTVELEVSAVDAQGAERSDLNPTFASSAPEVGSVDANGSLRLHRVGRATITTAVDEVSADLSIDVVADPVATYTLKASADTGRTGDVIHFEVVARDGSGSEVVDFPVRFSVAYRSNWADGVVWLPSTWAAVATAARRTTRYSSGQPLTRAAPTTPHFRFAARLPASSTASPVTRSSRTA